MLGYIRRNHLLQPGDRVAVAVSGGADSVALLRLMLEFRDELGIVLSVVHLNHKLRGAESEGDQEFVRDLAGKHNLEFTAESREVQEHSANRKLSLEAAARELRYTFFCRVLQTRTNRVATAHTLDDQAETVLLKLARGAGTRGLAGIYPRLVAGQSTLLPADASTQHTVFSTSDVDFPPPAMSETGMLSGASIIRPLLGTRRAKLREYLKEINQTWREDASNQDLRHTRNRIRHEILPRLEREVNPSICQVLAETAEIARAEEERWDAEISRLMPGLWEKIDSDSGRLLRKSLAALPLAMQRRAIRAAAESLGLPLEFQHVEGILSMDREGANNTLPDAWAATLHGDEIRFQKRLRQAADYEYSLPVPGRVVLADANLEIEALVLSGGVAGEKYNSLHLVSEEYTRRGLRVRNWRAGELFWPAHTKKPKKIKDLLQDRHITGGEKKLWPVVASGDEVIWMRGFGVRRDFQASGSEGILIREAEHIRGG